MCCRCLEPTKTEGHLSQVITTVCRSLLSGNEDWTTRKMSCICSCWRWTPKCRSLFAQLRYRYLFAVDLEEAWYVCNPHSVVVDRTWMFIWTSQSPSVFSGMTFCWWNVMPRLALVSVAVRLAQCCDISVHEDIASGCVVLRKCTFCEGQCIRFSSAI